MAVPKFQQFFPPVIKSLGDGKVHTIQEINEYCINELKLSEQDCLEQIPSGYSKVNNRIAWAKTYLKKAGLIESPARTKFRLTEEGMKAYQLGAECVTLEYLQQFESFQKFHETKNDERKEIEKQIGTTTDKSPREIIDDTLKEWNASLADDLLAEILKISPYEFESLVVKLLIKMGYGSLRQNENAVTRKSNDEGIDGIVTADKLGFDAIYVQAKQWKQGTAVGRPEVQKFLGALVGQGATKGLFITTTNFSKAAREFAEKHINNTIILVDGTMLTNLMIEYNLGVSTSVTYELKRIDYDFFSEEV